MTREEALQFIQEKITNQNIIKHMLATEVMMRALAKELPKRHPELVSGSIKMLKQVQHDKSEEFNEEEWGLAGLLHDGDYCEDVPVERQGIQISEWIKEKGFEIPEEVKHAMAAHNAENTGVRPESKMDWAIFCADSLTGLIVATALVLPSKKLDDVQVESVLKKFKDLSFARGTRREDIKMCEDKLGISLEEFVKICLEAMQSIALELGL